VVVAHLAPHMESALISVESECLLFSKFFKVALPLVCSLFIYKIFRLVWKCFEQSINIQYSQPTKFKSIPHNSADFPSEICA